MQHRLITLLILLLILSFATGCSKEETPVASTQSTTPSTSASSTSSVVDDDVSKVSKDITYSKSSDSNNPSSGGANTTMGHFNLIPIKVKNKDGSYETLTEVYVPNGVTGDVTGDRGTHYYASIDNMSYHMFIIVKDFNSSATAFDIVSAYASSMFDLDNKNYSDKEITDIANSRTLYAKQMTCKNSKRETVTKYYFARKLTSKVFTVTVGTFTESSDGTNNAGVKSEFLEVNGMGNN